MKQERQKGILVLDKPNWCGDCPLFTWYDENDPDNEMGECRFWGDVNGSELHRNCPIKPIEEYEAVREELKKRMEHPERYPKR